VSALAATIVEGEEDWLETLCLWTQVEGETYAYRSGCH